MLTEVLSCTWLGIKAWGTERKARLTSAESQSPVTEELNWKQAHTMWLIIKCHAF
jgi:hypothetical protein